MKIDIISRELIKPSSPTPSNLKNYKLSLFDQICPFQYVPLVLFYSLEEAPQVQQSEVSSILRTSLSNTLTQFYPLAGRVKGESSVDCNDKGVDYIETRVDSQLSNIIDRPELDVLNQLIPYKLSFRVLSIDKEEEQQPQLAIQVNLFNCGGVVIGLCISHKIADGCTLSTFIKGWAATARGKPSLVCPSFISATLFPPREPIGFKHVGRILEAGLVTRRLVFSASTIAALKSEVVPYLAGIQPTRVEVVTALIWKKYGSIASTSMAFHPVNIRKRMVPALPEHCFGNLFLMANAVSNDETDLATLVTKLRVAIEKIDCDYVQERQGEDGFEAVMNDLKKIGELVSKGKVQVLRFSSWCGFPIYEADFGWGKPSWVSIATMDTKNSIIIMDSKYPGGVEAWVTVHEQDVAILDQLETFISSFPTS
ncbi:vinorine synthase-like isoform X2 [Camellia sinensis]|uniref:vinorine synthase-like isoform X1 n=1 Tax=Camellia sinensis TaxID=4442 RepID=UPI0010358FE5|nr:vinorine synthase-like isoform X1 [Camellia sinensis]XP_028076283.1 vinorine synthase-like isoform X2 [Camellia sinensis]